MADLNPQPLPSQDTHFTVDPGGEVRPVIGGEIAAPGA